MPCSHQFDVVHDLDRSYYRCKICRSKLMTIKHSDMAHGDKIREKLSKCQHHDWYRLEPPGCRSSYWKCKACGGTIWSE